MNKPFFGVSAYAAAAWDRQTTGSGLKKRDIGNNDTV